MLCLAFRCPRNSLSVIPAGYFTAVTLSAGYFWSAWHDLGMSPEYNYDQFQISHFDDANILGWNGLFGRVEVAF